MKALNKTKAIGAFSNFLCGIAAEILVFKFFTPDRLLTKDVSRDQQRCESNKINFLGPLIILRKIRIGFSKI